MILGFTDNCIYRVDGWNRFGFHLPVYSVCVILALYNIIKEYLTFSFNFCPSRIFTIVEGKRTTSN